jgi:AcrR family transcriptional regulator
MSREGADAGGRRVEGLRKVPLSNPERRQEVFDAVLAVLADVGYERCTIDLVAQRARASKATLYDRWSSKAQLVVDAFQSRQPVLAEPDAGSFPDAVRHVLMSWLAAQSGDIRGLILALLEGSRRDKELARLRRERLSDPMRRTARAALDRARQRDEIPEGVDDELLIELPFALLFVHVLILGEQPGRELVDRIVDGALVPLLGPRADGAEPRGAGGEPGELRSRCRDTGIERDRTIVGDGGSGGVARLGSDR